jgi:hypothetical protein
MTAVSDVTTILELLKGLIKGNPSLSAQQLQNIGQRIYEINPYSYNKAQFVDPNNPTNEEMATLLAFTMYTDLQRHLANQVTREQQLSTVQTAIETAWADLE